MGMYYGVQFLSDKRVGAYWSDAVRLSLFQWYGTYITFVFEEVN